MSDRKYFYKYLKYRQKYIDLKNQLGGGQIVVSATCPKCGNKYGFTDKNCEDTGGEFPYDSAKCTCPKCDCKFERNRRGKYKILK